MLLKTIVSATLTIGALGVIPAQASMRPFNPHDPESKTAYKFGFHYGVLTEACISYYMGKTKRADWLNAIRYVKKDQEYPGEYRHLLQVFEPGDDPKANKSKAYCLKAVQAEGEWY